MPISVSCSCGRQYTFKDEFAGRKAKCPACGQVLQIPRQPRGTQAQTNAGVAGASPSLESGGAQQDQISPPSARPARGVALQAKPTLSLQAIGSVTAFVLFFVSFVFYMVWHFPLGSCSMLAWPAIGLILGILALIDISRSKGRLAGRGLAIGGLVANGAVYAFFLLALAAAILLHSRP